MGTKGQVWTRSCYCCWLKIWGWKSVAKRVANGQSKVPCDPRETKRFYPVSNPYLIRNASHDSSDLFPPFLGIILYIDPGSHPGRESLLSSHRVVSASSSSLCSNLRQDHPLPDLSFRSDSFLFFFFFLQNNSLFEFLTRQLPLYRVTKGVISSNSSSREFLSMVRVSSL